MYKISNTVLWINYERDELTRINCDMNGIITVDKLRLIKELMGLTEGMGSTLKYIGF